MIPAQAVPCPKSSSCGSVSTLDLAALLDDRDVLDAAADRRMVGVDAAVDHRDLDARAGAAAPGPLARDLLGRPDPLERRQAASRSNAADQAGGRRSSGGPRAQVLGEGAQHVAAGLRARCSPCLRDLAHEARELERVARSVVGPPRLRTGQEPRERLAACATARS